MVFVQNQGDANAYFVVKPYVYICFVENNVFQGQASQCVVFSQFLKKKAKTIL